MTRLLSHIAHADHPCALLFVRRWRPRRKEWCRLTIGVRLGSERYMDRERAVAHFNESALKRSIEVGSGAEGTPVLIRDEFFLDAVVDFASFAKGTKTAIVLRNMVCLTGLCSH